MFFLRITMPVQKTELTTKIEKLKQLEADAQKLQAEIVDQRPQELAGLYAAYGFTTVAEFIKAVKTAGDKVPAKKASKAAKQGSKAVKKEAKAAKKAGKPGRPKKIAAPAAKKEKKVRGRARITDDVKAQVRLLVAEGKSGAQIAKALGISLPSVQNIKKESGLVKARTGRTKTVKAAAVEVPAAPVAAIAEAPAAPAVPSDPAAN